jgi:hypothetical protein
MVAEKRTIIKVLPPVEGDYERLLRRFILFLELSGQDMAFGCIKFHLADADG